MKNFIQIFVVLSLVFIVSCKSKTEKKMDEINKEQKEKTHSGSVVMTAVGELELAAPYATESVANVNKMVDWPENTLPQAPEGFVVTKYADGFDNPRWSYFAPNGDLFVSEASTGKDGGKITVLRDLDNDGNFEVRETFLEDLHQPFGMLIIDNFFYVANTDGLYKYPYKKNQTSMKDVEGKKIVELPAGGYNNHWTRNIITNKERNKIYISVGSASNVAEHGMEEEIRRANILVVNLDGSDEKIYASGLRNPVGMDWNPANGELWSAINERDELGDELVPDYATSVKEGGFYGWPYSYFGQIEDPRLEGKAPELVANAIVPDVPLGPHTASLGFTFYDATAFPEKYRNGAFVGQHGSWNRSVLSGYKVVFIPFENGAPKPAEDFLTGFIADKSGTEVYGRPVAVTVSPQGDLLVNDDSGNAIWKVSYQAK
ncbi:PQQ-dependent sugar dehydrogenase [Gelidibacter mesophilus]|uniref:PQQ-dependent sugar dehydrogenase n=1 Tax=Gelidibacter mesophilus TaxID=169050 RepID=UPI000481268F|nr:sorbosone dehydrogenase family protein [Gelidibacter mesophilus]